MKLTFEIDSNYLGSCAICGKDATHAEWCKFDELVKIQLDGYPDILGIWHHVCNNCCDKTLKHEENGTKGQIK